MMSTTKSVQNIIRPALHRGLHRPTPRDTNYSHSSRSSSTMTSGSAAVESPLHRRRLHQPPQQRTFVTNLLTSKKNPSIPSKLATDFQYAQTMVRKHDPSGFLPGQLLPTPEMQAAHYVVRSLWVETGLRFGNTARLPAHSSSSPEEELQWWKQGVESILQPADASSIDQRTFLEHPTLRLLHHLNEKHAFTKCHFDDVFLGRRTDLDLKQYPDLESLKQHAEWSCGSLAQLVLEAGGIFQEEHPIPHQAAKLVGKAHGLTNALRTSIPVVSTTGKLIIPQDLCEKYGVKSPRYLLSALGQGDEECIRGLRHAVQDIAQEARKDLQEARALRSEVLSSHPHAGAVLLPGLASETFLDRLEAHEFDLTNRDLRQVHWTEHARCAWRMISASYHQDY